jgi:hypothetical protein
MFPLWLAAWLFLRSGWGDEHAQLHAHRIEDRANLNLLGIIHADLHNRLD